MPESEKQLPDEHSKGKRKREMEALQDLGAKLLKLNEAELATLQLPDVLLAAIKEGKRLKAHEAKRRHLQYVGKLMRSFDAEPLRLAMKKSQSAKKKETDQFHDVEIWRDRLIEGDDTDLQQLLELHPTMDRQHLRQLVRKAKHDRAKQKDTGGSTELFRYIREAM